MLGISANCSRLGPTRARGATPPFCITSHGRRRVAPGVLAVLFNCSGELCADADPRMALAVSSADMIMIAIIPKILVANNQMSAVEA